MAEGSGGLRIVEAKVAALRGHERNPRRIRPERLQQLKRTLEAERDIGHYYDLIVGLCGSGVVAVSRR